MVHLDARRAQLRAFLMNMRARLDPTDLGFPDNGSRRVPGLRRCEVAELAGVSELWYRLFESGHDVNVSRGFLASLASALRLNDREKLRLYRLAIKELYASDVVEGDVVDALVAPSALASVLTAIDSPSEIERSVRTFAQAREAFLNGSSTKSEKIRSRIYQSWKRSQQKRVDYQCADNVLVAADDELQTLREKNFLLLEAAKPVLAHLSTHLGADRYAVILTDAQGMILDLVAEHRLRSRLSEVGIVAGTQMSEECLGTNGIGTAITDARPLQIVGPEHFRESWRELMCNGAPIRSPITGEIIGILDATADYRLARPELMGVMLQYAYAIEETIAKASA